ncbi:MAG: DNA mismatch repair protein MutL, partial [Muribaculaceae bacterium]|nr:DNA mismatch repair protein MutL [Muribaculaceae bacterium]
LSASQQPIMESMVDELGAAGFDMAYLGNNTWSINGMPAVIDKLNPVETITSLVDYVAETNQQATDTIKSRIALGMARASAVKPGQSLTVAEMDALMLDLLCLPAPGFTPDGLPVLTIVDMDTIAGML